MRWIWSLVLAAVVAIVVTPILVGHSPAAESPAPYPARIEPGERLLPQLAFVMSQSKDGDVPQIPFFEVLGDGTLTPLLLPVPENGAIEEFRAMPDGRVIVRASQDLMPGVARPDGPFARGIAFPLMVVDGTGAIVSNRDVRRAGGYVTLLGASATHAFLLRTEPETGKSGSIVAYDLTTAVEREVAVTAIAAGHGDVAGGELIFAGATGESTCDVSLITISTGTVKHLTVPACDHIADANLSPDGRFAVIVYDREAGPELRVRVIDRHTDAIYSDQHAGRPVSCINCLTPAALAGYLGTSWVSPTAVRITRMEPLPLSRGTSLSNVQKQLRHKIQVVPG